jgi:MYXO-CTERM domain-containing protein
MEISSGFRWLVVSASLSIWAYAPTVAAAPIGYSLVSGQVTAVTLDLDQTNRLDAPVSLDAGSVNVDFDALTLNILSVAAAGPGLVHLNGVNGWDDVTFTNASFGSLQVSALINVGGGNYIYGVPVQVQADLLLNPGGVFVDNFSAQSNAGGTIIALNGNQTVDITVNGVVLGALCDPIDQCETAPPVLVKADFHFVASTSAPEPSAAWLALFGAAAALGWRRLS